MQRDENEEAAQNIPQSNTQPIEQPIQQLEPESSQPPLQQEESSNDSVEHVKEHPKFIAGKLAVCMHCGYLSEDFNKCLRCKRKLPEDVKSVSVTTTNNKVVETLKSAEKKSPQKIENRKLFPSYFLKLFLNFISLWF